MTRNVIIAGGGQAAFQTATSLRQNGFDGRIVLIGSEKRIPYQRPPLSKSFLKGDIQFDQLLLRSEDFYQANRIELLLGCTMVAIDRRRKFVKLDNGQELAFDHLVLALGARNRHLSVEGVQHPNVHYLRTAEDAESLRARLAATSRLAVVGGGFIGLEVAASARVMGIDVTVLEAAPRLMGRVVSAQTSAFFLDAHRAMGTKVILNAAVQSVLGTYQAEAIELADGGSAQCDTVLVAAGVVPNQAIAEDAGLAVSNGIIVDAFMTTNDPSILAIGDCAVFHSPYADGPVRLESVQNAVDQAKCAAATIVGATAPYDSVPWFWSEQGAHKLQMVGITNSADHVHVVGTRHEGSLVAYCFRGERFLGIETVNRPGEHMMGRKMLSRRLKLARSDVERTDFDLKAHLAALPEQLVQ